MINKILLPIDGSGTCQKAFDYAKEYALKFNSEITVLYVQEGYSDLFKEGSKYYDIDEVISDYYGEDMHAKNLTENQKDQMFDELIDKILDHAKAIFKEDNIDIKTVSLKGRSAHEILDYSEDEAFDMIIMCTHGMSALKRFTLGSTTNKVVHHAKIPVLIVR